MNRDMEHQKLVRELNRIADKKRMEELDKYAAPFFYAMLVIIGLIMWGTW